MPPSASVEHPARLRRESIRQIRGLRACGNDVSTPKYFGSLAVPAVSAPHISISTHCCVRGAWSTSIANIRALPYGPHIGGNPHARGDHHEREWRVVGPTRTTADRKPRGWRRRLARCCDRGVRRRYQNTDTLHSMHTELRPPLTRD